MLADPALSQWRVRLEKIRRFKPHVLSEAEERLLALGSAALHGHKETFSQLTNVDMQFGVITDEHGDEVTLTQSSFSSFLNKRERELRRTAFHQFYREFSDHRFTLASALSSSVKADVFRARARNHSSALEGALFGDRIPVSVYDNLISAVRANLDPLHRYYDLRRRVLGLDEIHQYDTYVPIVGDIETQTSFDDAITLVVAALAPLGGEYTAALEEGLRRGRWCDRYETKGKRSGAFSYGSYGNPPFIMMNYKADVFSDVYTLAHEAGHSMHTWYANRTQRYQDADYPIFLAEVASTFNEELLTHHLLERTEDKKMRAYLLNRQLDDLRGTLYRQTMFAEFEKIVHAMEEAGEALTLDSFKSAYHELLTTYFGPLFALDEELDIECLRIPHFYNAFYVYKYSTGISRGGQPLGNRARRRRRGSQRVSRISEVRRRAVSAGNIAGSRRGHEQPGAGGADAGAVRPARRGTRRTAGLKHGSDPVVVVGIDLAWGERNGDGLCLIKTGAGSGESGTPTRARVAESAHTFGDAALLGWLAAAGAGGGSRLRAALPRRPGGLPEPHRQPAGGPRWRSGFSRVSTPGRIPQTPRGAAGCCAWLSCCASNWGFLSVAAPAPIWSRGKRSASWWKCFRIQRSCAGSSCRASSATSASRGAAAEFCRAEFARLQGLLRGWLASRCPELENSDALTALLSAPLDKPAEDRLDALVCALVGYQHWRSAGRETETIGDRETGFILLPRAATALGVTGPA